MKKLLYLIPLFLLLLNATSLSFYKSTVNYSPGEQLYHLTPSYWKQLSIKVSKSNQSVYQSAIIVGNAGTPPSPKPISVGASFHGFPISFYFQNSNVKNENLPNVQTTIKAFSWLFLTVDSLIVIVSLIVVIWLVRQKHNPSRKPNKT